MLGSCSTRTDTSPSPWIPPHILSLLPRQNEAKKSCPLNLYRLLGKTYWNSCSMDHVLNMSDSYIFTPYVYPASWTEDWAVRQIISLWVVTNLGAELIYLGFGTLSFYYVFDHKLMKHPQFIKNQVRKEIQLGTVAIFWMSFPTVALFFWEVRGNSKLYDNISGSPLGWSGVFLSIAGFLFFTDMSIYWIHRSMHHKNIYKHLHKQHHIFKIPTPFASHAFHPLDGFLQSLPYHVYPFVFPLHKVVYLSLFVFVNIWTISIHDGDYRLPGPLICLINGAAHHTDHHLFFNYNYGQYFTLWDRLGGSYRHPSALLRKGPHDHIRELKAEAAQTQ
ncbi:lathosterol oxidase-like isoform X1 [Micropterus salmoides]|uniref:lathosterol oxidase-like isoform X1 n=2 Tax=Micropterus salmoides TaxID=27706 RepID=UPI0018EB5495|nr:lathosterol oxidase-like isoform X1 [Micropterus salmoides]XP_038561668.1 lathosterol oxidase-like isoform X1 [Micropterus salmoides]